jgi:hypothetical protein
MQVESKGGSFILSKVKNILSKTNRIQLSDDIIIKSQIQAIFSKEMYSNNYSYPQIGNSPSLLLDKLIELITIVFNMTANKREKLYNQNVLDIQNKKISNLVKELSELENIDYDTNEALVILFNKINEIINKKEALTLFEYIDSVFINLAFLPECGLLLKYKVYSYITRYYLSKLGIILKFRQNEINLEDEKEIKLIVNLFEKEELNDIVLVQSIIILNYDSLSDTIAEFDLDLDRIIKAIKAVSLKVKNIKNNVLCIERIMLMFTDELEMPEKLKNKIKDRKKSKKENTGENIPKKEDAKKVEHDEEPKTQDEKIKDGDEKNYNMISVEDNDDVEAKKESIGANIQKKEDFKKVLHDEEPKAQDEKIKDGDAKNLNVIFEEGNDDEKKRYNEFQNKNNKDNMIEGEKLNDKINILFEKILNKINMGNDVKINLEEIKSNINIIIDENQKMKEKVFIMENKMEQMNQQIQELSKENDSIKEQLGDLKEVVGEIQTRDLIRNFLECFKTYLTPKDKNDIKDGKITTGKALSNRIGIIFSGVDKNKLYLVQNLLEISSDLLEEGNYFAHELFVENFDRKIEDYKKKNNLDKIESPEIFCFLTNFDLTDTLFDNSYSFLKQYFKKNLKKKKDIDILQEYFN